MEMEHGEYLEVQAQLQDHFDGRYVKQADCRVTVADTERKIDGMAVELTKINTTLKMLIGILGAIAVPILAVAVKLLFS